MVHCTGVGGVPRTGAFKWSIGRQNMDMSFGPGGRLAIRYPTSENAHSARRL